jgi:PKD repeat protein
MEQHPSFTFMDDGTYLVTLTVTDEDGSMDTVGRSITIGDLVPIAAFNWAPNPQDEGSPVQFTDASTSYPDDIVAWSWDFGGLGTSSDQHPSFTFTDDGSYTVTLSVVDDDGSTDICVNTVTIINVAPTVDAGADQTVNEGALVSFNPATFTDDGTGDTHIAIIDWGDGIVDLGLISEIAGVSTVSGSHTYADNGDYLVTVTVTDDDGATDVDTLIITVNNVTPLLSGTADQTGAEGSPITFLAGTVVDPGADTFVFRWDWGSDGAYDTPWSSSNTASYTWADDYTGVVTVQVRDDDGGIGSDTVTVTIENVAPSVIAGAAQTVDEGSLVTFAGGFTDPGADTHTYQWDFGDGTTASGTLTPTHVYADDGVYTIKLTVTDDDNGVGTDILTVTVLNVAPTVSIDAISQFQTFALPDLTVIILDPVVFIGSATDPGTDTLTYYWTFGDSTGAANPAVTHSYGVLGTYTVTLTVEDNDGGVGTASVDLTVWGPRDLKTSVLFDLEASKTGEWWVDKRLERVMWFIEQSLTEKLWVDETHLDAWHGWRVFFYEFLAEIHLEIRSKLYSHFIPMLEDWIECLQAKGYDTTWLDEKLTRMQALVPVFEAALFKLAKADELLARVAIMDAASTPVQNSKWQAKVDCYLAKATGHMTKAVDRLEAGRFASAIWHYKIAWTYAQQAMKWANKTGSGCSCLW